MKKIIAAIILVLLLVGMASAMRWNIGASQVSRIDIGAAQESEDTQAIINGWWHRRRQGLHHEPLNLIPLRQTIDIKLSERAVA